ncbi:RNA methyltransferase [Balneolales bacterium ANBcel1]|nr:RNA methyltransferase [Balneolales bacterium ANBcel1]
MSDFKPDNASQVAEAIAFFSEYVSDHKKTLFRSILESRTRFFTVVLEDIYQPQNASAVLRSCDGFGIQDVHVIENRNVFDVDKGVTIGSDKWLTVNRYNDNKVNNTERAYRHLREKGYRIVATTPHEHQISLPDFYPDQPTALVFGAEKAGLTPYAIDHADEWLYIPMFGFSESFNISVCVALCLYQLRRVMSAEGQDFSLSESEKEALYLHWIRKSIRKLDALDRKFLEKQQPQEDRP